MISAFGVEHTEISKGLRIPGRLKPNEYWHGTRNSDAIKTGGFKLANPQSRTPLREGRLTRAGRQMTNQGAHGPGVYLTRSKRQAKTYGTPVKVKVDPATRFAPARDPKTPSRQVTTPEARKSGYGGVQYPGRSRTTVVGDPRKVSLA